MMMFSSTVFASHRGPVEQQVSLAFFGLTAVQFRLKQRKGSLLPDC